MITIGSRMRPSTTAGRQFLGFFRLVLVPVFSVFSFLLLLLFLFFSYFYPLGY